VEINSLRAQIGATLGGASGRPAPADGNASFVESLSSALKTVSRAQLDATALQRQFQLGNPAVSLEETMIAMNKASLSFQAAVQTRNRLVQAYEQIMNMPV